MLRRLCLNESVRFGIARRQRPRRCRGVVVALRKTRSEVVGVGNLCVDVRLSVDRLPRQLPGWHAAFMEDFLARPPRDALYEPGGVMNTLFVLFRLGVDATVVARVGSDYYGRFCRETLRQESIPYVQQFDLGSASDKFLSSIDRTSLCLVIVDPLQQHLFCSTFDVTGGPVFCPPLRFSESAMERIQKADAVFTNGYAFQECSGEVMAFIFEQAIRADTATFFDPGPHGVTLAQSSQRSAVLEVMRQSSVLLMTEEEAMQISGESDAIDAARFFMTQSGSLTQWVVIKLGANGSCLLQRGTTEVQYTPGFAVDLSDTVGCGDSFAAGVVHGYLMRRGEPPVGVMELANAIGAVTATAEGAGRNVAHPTDVRDLLQKELSGKSLQNGGAGLAAALELILSDTLTERAQAME